MLTLHRRNFTNSPVMSSWSALDSILRDWWQLDLWSNPWLLLRQKRIWISRDFGRHAIFSGSIWSKNMQVLYGDKKQQEAYSWVWECRVILRLHWRMELILFVLGQVFLDNDQKRHYDPIVLTAIYLNFWSPTTLYSILCDHSSFIFHLPD